VAMIDPVFFFFYHLIQTESLPRKMASETFFAKFTEYCEKEDYPTPKDMETVVKIIESVPGALNPDHRDYHVRIFTGEIYFPDPDMLKKWLDAYSTVTRDAYSTVTREVFLPKRCSFKAKENGLCMRHQLNKKEYENDGICQANVHYSKPPAEPKKRGRPPKTPVDAPQDSFEKENLRQRRQARRREKYKSNPERERASTKRCYWKKKGTDPPTISENEKENRRQRRLARRRENYKRRSESERERERASQRRRK